MSSKTKTTAAKEEARPVLVPKLRFPEFRGAEWVQKKLEDVAPLQRGFDLPSDLIRPGDIPIVYSNGIQKYHEVGMATAPGIVTGRSGTIGKLHFIEHGEYWPHNTSLWVTDFKGNDPRFVYYLYDSIGMGRFSSGSGVPTLNRNDVHAFSARIPSSTAEQQKIAECLSSVDELMAAQARKVDALKTHKKGLMQQLFPREGETQPRLRFPEFQNAGEWEVKAIGDVFRVTRGEVLSMTLVKDEASNEAPFPVYSSQTKNKGLAGYYSEHLYEDAITWTTDGANAGDVNFRPGKFYCTNVCGVLINTHGYANACVAALLNSVTRSHVSYVGNPKLMNGVMAKIEIPFPPLAEQQRIASCLSSLDALITAGTQKLEGLKTHKKGLMQQFFPSPEEVKG